MAPFKHILSLGPSSSFHEKNQSYHLPASVIPICDPEYVMRICNMIDFGHDWLRMDQDLPLTYEGKFYTQLTVPNLL